MTRPGQLPSERGWLGPFQAAQLHGHESAPRRPLPWTPPAGDKFTPLSPPLDAATMPTCRPTCPAVATINGATTVCNTQGPLLVQTAGQDDGHPTQLSFFPSVITTR